MRIAVGIATSGRRDILTETILELTRQSRVADIIVVCPAKPDDIDLPALAPLGDAVQVITAPPGLTSQRNAIIDRCRDFDLILFLDDDFLPRSDYIANLEAICTDEPDIALITGDVIADGVRGPGITFAEGREMIARAPDDGPRRLSPAYSGYGCNMAVRMSVVTVNGLRFDENLPLYGWLEDLDFTRQVARHGRIVEANNLRGVHLATKKGRVSGVRYGYSQVANPIYLYRKNSIPLQLALRRSLRFCFANVVRSFFPEAFIDRRGRAFGNWLAISDLAKGKLDPRRIVNL